MGLLREHTWQWAKAKPILRIRAPRINQPNLFLLLKSRGRVLELRLNKRQPNQLLPKRLQ